MPAPSIDDVATPEEKLNRCLEGLDAAVDLVGHALDRLAEVQQEVERVRAELDHVGRPRRRRALPAIGPRRPLGHVVDEW